ncbi:L1 [Gammapapillomavirus 11]|uniref:Major capsid protein L1 n=1 Tax=Gammapapillomavirus 11 TaxID=1513256 RepID=A0A2D2ALK0_9PAPI|nr:L1 [Gammapapillomavirus 11]
MATWMPNVGRLYLPPAQPVARVLSTDEYVVPTDIYFHANTDRLLTVGHPYFDIVDSNDNTTVVVPKVSANQYRVLRMRLPDPNKFALIDKDIYNPDTERLVWRLQGLEIDRGGPLGVGSTGHPLFDKQFDTENPSTYINLNGSTENRRNVAFDPKQTQLFIVGCRPAVGQHWDVADPCNPPLAKGLCPPIKLVHSPIQDGDMSDIGLGAVNFATFSESRSDAPLEVINSICKYPDFIQMTKDIYGDHLFFYGRREQLYARHFFCKDGNVGDSIPEDVDNDQHKRFLLHPASDTPPDKNLGNSSYFAMPSGSLVSSESNLFNRPYWVHKAQGKNNGVCWGNDLFVTFVDNTHNTNFILSVYNGDQPIQANYQYKSTDFRHYMRHTEEVEIELIFQLCKVPLQADILAHINAMNPNILDEWQLAFVPAPPQNIEDTYRFIKSLATICPKDAQTTEKEDPYKNLVFWNIDMSDKFSSDLDQTPLGKKFLYQMGMITNSTKRIRSLYTTTTPTTARRKATKRKRAARG